MAETLTARRLEPEVMDDPGLDVALHRQALDGLAQINAVSRSAASLWRPIHAALQHAEQPLRLLDVACGGGDVTIALQRRALAAGLPLKVDGCDISATALDLARQRAAAVDLDMTFHQSDVLNAPLPAGYDIITCSLFLHHLEHDAAVHLLHEMARQVRLVVVNDLRRSRMGLIAAAVGVRLLSNSPVVYVDGPRSVRAAFSIAEMMQLAREAGLDGAQVRRCFAFRMLLTWSRT